MLLVTAFKSSKKFDIGPFSRIQARVPAAAKRGETTPKEQYIALSIQILQRAR